MLLSCRHSTNTKPIKRHSSIGTYLKPHPNYCKKFPILTLLANCCNPNRKSNRRNPKRSTANKNCNPKMSVELNARSFREEILKYSAEHPNDFGVPDGKDRIPMKKLMKLFGIKKQTAPETANRFRDLMNEHCVLEKMDGIGKVLVLKPGIHDDSSDSDDSSSTDSSDCEDDQPDYEYGTAHPSYVDNVLDLSSKKADSDGEADTVRRTSNRFRPPKASVSGGLIAVSKKDSMGLGDENRPRYRRRGSVTQYNIVGQQQVQEEFKRHEDVIKQFRRDSAKFDNNIRKLSLGNECKSTFSHNDDSNGNGSPGGVTPVESEPTNRSKKGKNGVKKFLGIKGRIRSSMLS